MFLVSEIFRLHLAHKMYLIAVSAVPIVNPIPLWKQISICIFFITWKMQRYLLTLQDLHIFIGVSCWTACLLHVKVYCVLREFFFLRVRHCCGCLCGVVVHLLACRQEVSRVLYIIKTLESSRFKEDHSYNSHISASLLLCTFPDKII